MGDVVVAQPPKYRLEITLELIQPDLMRRDDDAARFPASARLDHDPVAGVDADPIGVEVVSASGVTEPDADHARGGFSNRNRVGGIVRVAVAPSDLLAVLEALLEAVPGA